MINDPLLVGDSHKRISRTSINSKPIHEIALRVEGLNEDITEMYYWHLNFAYYTGKGYTPIKLEDQHYFSEASQFGTNIRQQKGGSIRAFQENLQQLIQLVKVHLLPALKEVKESDYIKSWFDKILTNDKMIQEELKKSNPNEEKLNLWRSTRNEAMGALKDRWVNEVDGGKLWQLSRSSAEQGLDFNLVPQLFLGINLDNPLYDLHKEGKSLQEQLDGDIYGIEITEAAKSQAGRFFFRFHTWLPTAIKEVEVTYKLKISALKQMYTQLQMYINFMKPLLIEISKKSEGFSKKDFFHNFEGESADFSSMLDYTYSFVRILGIRNFNIRGPWILEDLEFTKFGLFLKGKGEIAFGEHKNKKGFIAGEVNGKYIFYPSDKAKITKSEFDLIKEKKIMIEKSDLKLFRILEYEFLQKRKMEYVQTQQGPQQVPNLSNNLIYRGYAWNIFEIASYRNQMKEDSLKLLETFVEDIKIVREDLLYYIHELDSIENDIIHTEVDSNNKSNNSKSSSTINKDNNFLYDLIFGPFRAIGDMFSPLVPKFNNNSSSFKKDSNKENERLVIKLEVVEDLWKVYSVYKKSHQLLGY